MNMPARITPLVNGECYHIYNRRVAYLPTYKRKQDYQRFIFSLRYYQYNNILYKISRLLQLPADDRTQTLLQLQQEQDKKICKELEKIKYLTFEK